MNTHEFGIMAVDPQPDEQFSRYEPERYDCILVNDVYIEAILEEMQSVPCYWHSRQRPEQGLAYCGITLIPPTSADKMKAILERHGWPGVTELIALLEQAKSSGKYIIHFGI